MQIQPIRTDQDYRRNLAEVSAMFDKQPKPGTPKGDRFEVLLTLIEAWEAKHHPVEPPDPVDAIKFRMEQSGLTVKDLAPLIGRPSRVYEVLNRKRPLTLKMMWRLHQALGISAESLIRAQMS